ncbi:hypothetical protein BDBG_02091 [Blastomyces gilchristii SLH14081]|uniref:Uncharacterized protein n=1 Tax=Blastomyces gilchristii (strain SLH14081) TaxID=559298 RepID=A0A179UGW7_BLAGS|nr:uncharacterized protein BDBG_02091 [Blastomyces gilchristii SLH14081]OAT05752.1 hypothetical protein BDBG_02091 [Blastomyces gilchristii SLH14081]
MAAAVVLGLLATTPSPGKPSQKPTRPWSVKAHANQDGNRAPVETRRMLKNVHDGGTNNNRREAVEIELRGGLKIED